MLIQVEYDHRFWGPLGGLLSYGYGPGCESSIQSGSCPDAAFVWIWVKSLGRRKTMVQDIYGLRQRRRRPSLFWNTKVVGRETKRTQGEMRLFCAPRLLKVKMLPDSQQQTLLWAALKQRACHFSDHRILITGQICLNTGC